MAKVYDYESGVESVKNNGTNHYVYLSLNAPLTALASQVPPYSRVSVILTIYADTSTASNDAALNLSLTNSDGSTTYLNEFSKNNVVDGNGSSITNYSTFDINISDWFHSEDASAGELNGYGGVNTYIKCHFKLYTLTNYTWAAKYKFAASYDLPIASIKVSSNIGDSLDIVTINDKSLSSAQEYGQTFTITAKEVQGYKFVKWDDGSTSATRKITVGNDIVISQYYTTKTYTAIYEVAKINKILADTSQSLGVLIDLVEAKEIIADTTKVYG